MHCVDSHTSDNSMLTHVRALKHGKDHMHDVCARACAQAVDCMSAFKELCQTAVRRLLELSSKAPQVGSGP